MAKREMICLECGEDCHPKYIAPDNTMSNMYGYFGSACCMASVIDQLKTEYAQRQLEDQLTWEKDGNCDTEGM